MQYIQFFFIPLVLSLGLTPLVRRFALKYGFVALPRPDRWHQRPTALLGGIGIYIAAVVSAIYFGLANRQILGLFLGGTLLFVVGLADEKFNFAPQVKLLAQIIAGCIAVFFGFVFGLPLNIFLAVPLTLFWIIVITNAFNILDNIDGLAVGIAVVSGLMLFFSSQLFSNNPMGVLGLILAGAALGFLPYNFNPARIFMGDSGSMFLGFCLALISISGTVRHVSNLLITMFVPVLILSVPIFDTIFVMLVRRIQGRRIFEGGKDHTSHRLITLGLSPRKTVLLLYAISASFGMIAILYSRVNAPIISIVAFLAIVVMLFLGIFIFEFTAAKRKTSNKHELVGQRHNHTALNSILLYKRRIIEVLLDFVLICIAYYCAYFLRFEGFQLSSNLQLMQESLVWIILIKMSVFFVFGLYRGVWKYIGISDFFTMFKVVSISSVASIIFLTFVFRFREYSRAVLFIDWLLLLFLVMGSRFIFRIIGEFFSRVKSKEKKILIFGAGDTGEMVMREIKRNKKLLYDPVGFIDDDPYKAGHKIHGISVLGDRDKIEDLVRGHNIKEVIIAMPSIDKDDFSEIVHICQHCGIPYRSVRGILDGEGQDEFKQN
ncbi:hypothetical protein ACFL1K_00300 [Candidatus Omnitrophota bacterium]